MKHIENWQFWLYLLGIAFTITCICVYLYKKGTKSAKEYKERVFVYKLLGVIYHKDTILKEVEYRNRTKGARLPKVYIYEVSNDGIISSEHIAKVSIDQFNASML